MGCYDFKTMSTVRSNVFRRSPNSVLVATEENFRKACLGTAFILMNFQVYKVAYFDLIK